MRKIILLAMFAASAAGCASTRAQVPEQAPTLVVPPVPPRMIEPAAARAAGGRARARPADRRLRAAARATRRLARPPRNNTEKPEKIETPPDDAADAHAARATAPHARGR